MFAWFRNWLNAIRAGISNFYEEYLHPRDPKIELENQLRIMYARGEIDRDSFFHLRFRLQKNAIGRGEIILLHRAAMQRQESKTGLAVVDRNQQNRRRLDRLYLDQVLVEEARYEMEQRQKALRQEINWVKEQAESARQSAQTSLLDEDLARAYLEIWQDLLELSGNLEARLRSASQSMRRMETLEAEIRGTTIQLKLLESQEKITELHLRVRRDLLPR